MRFLLFLFLVACQGGKMAIPGTSMTATWVTKSTESPATAVCDDDEVAASGGCACDTGGVWMSIPAMPNGWLCACETPVEATAFVLCVRQ